MPEVQGGRGREAPPMTKCAIESTSRSNYQVDRRARPIPFNTGGVAFVALRGPQGRESGVRRGFRGFPGEFVDRKGEPR